MKRVHILIVMLAASAVLSLAAPAGAPASDGQLPYCIEKAGCHSRLIWKRSEAWSGFHASSGLTGGASEGFPWADGALSLGLACASFSIIVGAMLLLRRARLHGCRKRMIVRE